MPPYDFYGDYKEIHYEHVFNTEFSQQINISDLKQIDTNTYSGKIDQKIPYNKYGKRKINTISGLNNTMLADIIIKTKPGKYKVFVYNIHWPIEITIYSDCGITSKDYNKLNFEDLILRKNNNLRPRRIRYIKLLNDWFYDLFTINMTNDNNW